MAEKRERAAEMRDAGRPYGEIAKELGVGRATVYRWLNPDYAEKERRQSREWKIRNRLTCPDCGGPMNGQSGRRRPARCSSCDRALKTQRSRARIIAAIREWAEEHDGQPPSAVQWNPPFADRYGRHEEAREFRESNGRWPVASGVVKQFGSWNAAIRAAGFEACDSGRHRNGRRGDDPAVREEAIRRYVAGESSVKIAQDLGVAGDSVTSWVRLAGHEVRGRWGKVA